MSADKENRVKYGFRTAAPAQGKQLQQSTQDALLDDAYKRDIMANMLLSSVGQAAQIGAMYADTKQDTRNKEQLENKVEKVNKVQLVKLVNKELMVNKELLVNKVLLVFKVNKEH